MNKNPLSYSRANRMRDIINHNSFLLVVINRFHIAMGFGDKTVAEVCAENGVDVGAKNVVLRLASEQERVGVVWHRHQTPYRLSAQIASAYSQLCATRHQKIAH